jgi:multidrug efflux pump subunit AcrA (membrane-fusion protein)
MIRLRAIGFILLCAPLIGFAGCARDETRPNQVSPSAGLLVSVAPVVRAPMRSEVTLLGTTVALKQVTVRAPAAGFLSDLSAAPGDQIKRGQTVARLLTREDAAAKAGMKVAAQLDPADSDATAKAVQRYVSGFGIPVSAGDGGTVARRLASSGQFVNEFDPVVELVDPRSIYVEAQAPLDAIGSIRPGQPVTIASPALAKAVPARVTAILADASQGGQTFPVRIALQNPRSSISQVGVAVRVTIVTGVRNDALVIPVAALFINPETRTNYVFVVGKDGRAHRRRIAIGIRDQTRAQALSGLDAGETVITSGGYALADGLTVRTTTK